MEIFNNTTKIVKDDLMRAIMPVWNDDSRLQDISRSEKQPKKRFELFTKLQELKTSPTQNARKWAGACGFV